MNYEEMIERAFSKLPEKKETGERFEIPKVRGHIQGNKTVISNFHEICSVLRRKPEHVLKFLLKELATPGEISKNFLILGRKISASQINEKIDKYAKMYVFCPECKKPDTELIKESSFTFIKCSVCGAKRSVP
jgi:translation initiation factor 2 subunit 2